MGPLTTLPAFLSHLYQFSWTPYDSADFERGLLAGRMERVEQRMRATIAGQLLNLTPTFDPPQQGQRATDANTERKIAMASRIERAAGCKLAGKSVAVLGVGFKPDDVRDAPSLTLIPMLQEKGASAGLRPACQGECRGSSCRG